MKQRNLNLILLASISSALAAATATPSLSASTKENCYGVALQAQNDCAAAQHSCSGQATIDYDGQSWKKVPKGTCTSMKTPYGPGSLTPIKRPA